MTPSIGVVVLTRDRRELLARCLRSLGAQHGGADSVHVVDNGSEDGTQAMVRAEFPDVVLIENGENLGIAGRNIGYRACSADVILSLDDDVELVDPDTLENVRTAFAGASDLGAVTLKILEEATGAEFVDHHWWHPRDRKRFQDERFETDRINEAAVAFRSSALDAAGYYYEALFWGGEEWDLVLGIMDEGYRIEYLPIPVLHLAPRGNLNVRADARQALLVRNRFWIALRRLSPWGALGFILPRSVLWLFRALRYGYLGRYLQGLWGLLRSMPQVMRDRRPISPETRRRLRSIRTPRARGVLSRSAG